VAESVSFIVRNLDPQLLRRLRTDARAEKRSLQDFIRHVLCEHYDLDCPSIGATPRLELGARTKRVLLNREVWEALKADSEETGESMQQLVHQALAQRYVTEQAA
jgi:predicted HicB family RNase H-like nuclease